MFFTPVVRRASLPSTPRFVDRGVERFLSDALLAPAAANRVRFTQDEQRFTLSLDVPGLAKEQLTLDIEGNVVRIASVDDAPRTLKAAYELPQEIDVASSQATLEHGVLTLQLGKKAPVGNVMSLAIQ